ncbi:MULTISPECIES: GntR family transcriptional regulator [unclassified Enterococcus]|uniref:GntR family transcriptional regulator n=1 Tax=unclassified Enterococcus TaxID=2608891 RepID=UPI001CE1EAFD|nr:MULTISPECIES: GntR family transcriptional regulator [unclassified Enterococcus]MCA5013022.1 GntR family transcriptional regulator [Enterococcus sp. S23]MCA5016273.1 GntR family transcriptional regulator [Enterococcus sp. S22(2020)]
MNLPLYKKIEQDLLDKIEDGTYAENELIPTELELAEEYQVSRPTVRQAVQTLVDAGYLEKRKKRGTIVKRPKIEQEFTKVIESFDSEMSRKGLVPKTKVIAFRKDAANEEVAGNLEILEGDDVYKLIRLRYAGEKPTVLVTTYIPAFLFKELDEVDFSTNLLYSIFKEKGFPIKTVSRRLDVIQADDTVSDLLDVEVGAPLFYFHTRGFTDGKLPIEYSISKYRGDINSFVFEITENG